MTAHVPLVRDPSIGLAPNLGPESERPTPALVSFAKTVTWRFVAAVDTFVISYLITGSFGWAGSIVGVEVISKMALYYAHERAWSRIPCGWAAPAKGRIRVPLMARASTANASG